MLNKAIKKAKENKKGFTLAELLIVVAIIAVLVAISIPIFNSQLEKSREATDMANIRAAYAEVQAAALAEETTGNATVTGTGNSVVVTEIVKLKQQKAGWQTAPEFPANLEAVTDAAQPTGTKNQEVTITYTAATGKTTISVALSKATE